MPQPKCKTAMWNIHKIRMIRPYLDQQTCEILVSSLVTSHLNYWHALLAGITDAVIRKYQRVQNIAARLILNIGRRDSAIEARKKLHWSPIQSRIEYKIALLVFKCLMGNALIYLYNLLCISTGLDSVPELGNNKNKLIVPYVKNKSFAACSFSIYGPRLWNSLSFNIRKISSHDQLKSALKTYLFNISVTSIQMNLNIINWKALLRYCITIEVLY